MTTIAILNGKGGVGKTTLATIVGVEIGSNWIDTDPQGSLAIWGARREATVHETSGAALPWLLNTLQGNTIIDTPGALVTDLDNTIAAVDLIVIPTSIRQADVDAIGATAGVAIAAGAKAAIVLTRVHPRTRVENVSHLFDGLGLPLCPHRLAERVIYDHAFCSGSTAAEFDPASPAAEESKLVADWLLNYAQA